MREILSELYNKVANFFQSEKEGNSKQIASNRLKLVLMQDRTNLDSSTLERMRIELVEVISKYVEIDRDEFAVNLEGDGDSVALMLNIPVLRAKTPEELEALNQQEDNKEEENSEADEENVEAESENSNNECNVDSACTEEQNLEN